MSKQFLALRKTKPITIETPLGLIRITEGRKRKIEIELPGSLKAWVGDERAMENAKYLKEEDGVLKPTFQVMKPVVDEDGAILDVCTPKLVRLSNA